MACTTDGDAVVELQEVVNQLKRELAKSKAEAIALWGTIEDFGDPRLKQLALDKVTRD